MCSARRYLPILVIVLAVLRAPVAAAGGSVYDEVTVEPTRTSIYIGSVGLTVPPLRRSGQGYETTYVAKVRPYFFANERGTLRIVFDDAQLERLAAGETVPFSGAAVNDDGEPREVTGRAAPDGPDRGRLKVRVRVSPRIELIFNTTYRFTGPEPSPAAKPAGSD